MNIMGLNFVFHDSSACIFRDGEMAVALEDERFTGEKHTSRFPFEAINHCLAVAGLKAEDLDHIAISFNPSLFRGRKLLYAMQLGRGFQSFYSYEFKRIKDRLAVFEYWLKSTFSDRRRPKIHFVDHHLAHGAGSFFVSPFEKAAVVSIDGWGEWASTWLGSISDRRITKFGESFFPHSLGCFYTAATEYCGFIPNYDEGKTMGLAPTGDSERYYDTVSGLARVDADGSIRLDHSFFAYQDTNGRFAGKLFDETFGPRRSKGQPIAQHHCDVAAAFQRVLEERVLEICRCVERRSKLSKLVLSGGVALNSVANGRVRRELDFEDIYVMPGAGDNGTSIGAASYVMNHVLGETKRYHHSHAYVGNVHSTESIIKFLDGCKLDYRVSSNVCLDTAKLLHQGKIVAWFQGRMEFGPRALGNRSILADPTKPWMKDHINAQVKHREAFRPFAPSVTEEDVSRYFDYQGSSPFMLMVCDVLEEKRNTLPAITHVDGTARLQTVSRESNPRYYDLIREFEALSGVPVLLNTSFNIMGQPIIESPEDAVKCMYSTGIDVLVMEDIVLEKVPSEHSAQPASVTSGRKRRLPADAFAK